MISLSHATFIARRAYSKMTSLAYYAYLTFLAVFLSWIFAFNVLGFPYKIGTDGQKLRCLPWSVFALRVGQPTDIQRGDLLQFKPRQVGYGFDGLLWVKMVGAIPGDRIDVKYDELWINGKFHDRLWLVKTLGKAPGFFNRSFILGVDEYLMLGTTKNSYDSRYWGPIKKEAILAAATPLF